MIDGRLRQTAVASVAVLCLSGCIPTEHRAPASGEANPTVTTPACSPRPTCGTGGAGVSPLRFTLDHYTYHRIPTSVGRPAREIVVIGKAPNVQIVRADAVIVRTGVDIAHGPFTHHLPLLRDAPADGLLAAAALSVA